MLTLFLTNAALACGGEPIPGLHPQSIAGWTRDSRYLVVDAVRIDEDGSESPVLSVLDTRTDRSSLVEGDAVAKWRSEHPLEKVNTAEVCGDAKRVHQQEYLGGAYEGTWGAGGYLTAGVIAGGRTWVHAEMDGRYSVQGVWSPDCRRIGWLVGDMEEDAWRTVGPFSPRDMAIAKPAGPVIHIMAHRSLPEAVDPIFEGLTGAGFAPHVGAKAMKDRDATVVYASGDTMDLAKKVAAAVPGGATVEPLTWYTPADIIVAAGRTAVKP